MIRLPKAANLADAHRILNGDAFETNLEPVANMNGKQFFPELEPLTAHYLMDKEKYKSANDVATSMRLTFLQREEKRVRHVNRTTLFILSILLSGLAIFLTMLIFNGR